MIGSTVNHYTILEKLGEGGMGVVYKAHDTKLDRTVALKFLPPQASEREETKTRFLQEARAAAALNHPDICTVHGIEEANGQLFIVMEYIDGGTLREAITKQRLTHDQSIGLAIQIGEALQEAHGKGVVHRDIKADNIMLNVRGQAKIMDFGLAKLKGTLKLTRTSSTVGTLAYMAPEQIQGEESDARSDIFSFGVLVFEMLTGRLPFRGEHEAAMMYSLLNEAPESLTTYVPDASPELIHVIDRVLEKDRNDRYQTVAEMVIDLRRLKRDTTKVIHTSALHASVESGRSARTATLTINIPPMQKKPLMIGAIAAVLAIGAAVVFFVVGDNESGDRVPIAVADFENKTNEPELDGLSGMLITSLEQSKRLSVATRSRMLDVLKLLGKGSVDRIDESLGKEVARQANIGNLVTASIRKFGKLYTIDLKVLDTKKNEYIFTTKEEGEGQESIPGMLDKLAERTRAGLKESAVVASDLPKISQVTTGSMAAYQHYFRGEDLINKIRMDEAREEFQKAISIDPEFGLAYYRIAYTNAWRFRIEEAEEPIQKALALIDRIPAREQFLLRSLEKRLKSSYAEAVDILMEAEKSFPSDKEIAFMIGDYEYHGGELPDAITYLEKALTLDPTFERALEHLSWSYRDVLRFDKMSEVARRFTRVSDSSEAYIQLFTAYNGLRQYDSALQVIRDSRSGMTQAQVVSATALVHVFRGDFNKAEEIVLQSLASARTQQAERSSHMTLASLYPFAGRFRDAYRSMDRVVALSWHMGDTASALYWQTRKAFSLIVGHRALKEARKELDATVPFASRMPIGNYWGFRVLATTLLGNFAFSDSVMQHRKWPIEAKRFHWAEIAFVKNQPEIVLAIVDTIMARGGFDLAFMPEIFLLKGRVLMQMDSYEASIASLSRIELLPSNGYGMKGHALPQSYFFLGQAYEKKGQLSAAKTQYDKLLSMWKNADQDLPMLVETKKRMASLR